MNTIQYLEDQAARAERLAKRITDTPTIEKLLTFAGDRRREIEVIAGAGAPDAVRSMLCLGLPPRPRAISYGSRRNR